MTSEPLAPGPASGELARLARAFPTLLRVGFAESIAYRAEFLVWVLSTTMPIIMLLLWTAVARDQPIGRFGEAEFSAYFMSTLVVRLLSGAWVVWEMNYEIRQGKLAMRLLRPVHVFIAYAAENLAAVPFRLLLSLPIAAATVIWLGTRHFTSDPVQWGMVVLSLAGAWALFFTVQLTVATLGLYFESSLSLMRLWLGLYFVFSGYTIPLELFPASMRGVVNWLPFRFQISSTVETLLGHAGPAEALLLLAAQWAYAALFLGLALLLYRRGLRRYAAYGG
jgi:ABC-2 type transport system permease protein